jgi:beta-lactamase regulating signal transducer with metallopeptidase domain/type II secretory pathway component GspD/PulD (secretin)
MDELATSFSRIAWTQLWQVTLLIALVWLVLRLIGRDRPHLACALWLVVLVKCLTPPVVSSPSGVFCWLQRTQQPSDEVDQPAMAALPVAPVTLAGSDAAGPHGDSLVVRARPLPMIDPRLHESPPPAIAATGVVSEPRAATVRSLWPRLLWTAAIVWLAGTLVFSLAAAVRFLACWRQLRAARQADDPALVQLVESLRSRLALRRKVRLLVTGSPLGPAVVGLWRPAVILPAALVQGKTPAELEPLVAHELMHIRRGDLWVGLVQTLALGLWWFHPLVRLASRLVTREAERCCDEETIAQLGCHPAAYARSLLDVLALKQQLSPIPAFPGVRPVDVTSQRLERIMQLGQGCHKRTPWWCWLAMFALAAAVLPGAALVVGAKEKPKPAPRLSKQYIRPDFPLSESGSDGKPAELVTRTYDVADLLAALAKKSGDPESSVRLLLTQLVQSSAPGPWEKEGDSGGRAVNWDDGKLVVRQTDDGHQRIDEQLAVLREHGYAQIVVEVRIITGPAAVLNAKGVGWRMIGGRHGDEPLPNERKPRPTQLQPAGTAMVRLVDEGSGQPELSGTAVSVVEKNVPAMQEIIGEREAMDLLEAAQRHPKTNVLQAPKVTLFNGQSARIEDSVQRPFVVGVTPVEAGDSKALKPMVRVFSEGTSIRLRPVAQKDGPIRLDFDLELSQIFDVETAEFPTGPGKEPITVQIPEVATTLLSTTVEMIAEQTLVLSVPKTGNGKKEQQPMCVLVKVRQLNSPAHEAIPSPAKTTSDPKGSVLAARRAADQFAFETSGWQLRFAPKNGGKFDVEQTNPTEPLAKLSIRGGVYLDAAAASKGSKGPDRIQAEADAVQIASQAAAHEVSPGQLDIALEGNVRFMHNESRIEARRIVLHIDDRGGRPAAIQVQVTDAQSMDLLSKYYHRDDVQYFQPAPTKAEVGLVEKIYPVADLVIPIPSGPIKVSASGSLVKRDAPAVTKPDFDSLIELITTTIRPDSWDRVGGQGKISTATSSYSLIIRQEEQVHIQIADVLQQLRRLQDVQVVLTLQRLEVSAAELEKAFAGNAESPLRPLADNPKSRVWCLKADSIATLKGLPGAKLHTGPKVTTFNGQSVDLRLVDEEQRRRDLLTGLACQPLVTADFRSLRLQVFGDTTLPANAADGAADKVRTSLDLAIAPDTSPRQLPHESRELVLGQVLVVDESLYAWQEHEQGVPVLDKVPGTARLFKNTSAKKSDLRHFYLITPSVLVASEEEDGRILAPRKE